MVLHSRHPMFLWWGSELIQFYNDAYLPSFGRGKHPEAMGQRGRECWQEIWPIIWPQIEAVMTRAEASWNEDALVPIYRNGRIEEVYWTYGYSPVFDDDGGVGGTLVVCTETTSRVIANRRSEFIRQLGERISSCSELDEVLETARRATAAARLDVPFLLNYQRTAVLGRWDLRDSTHLAEEAAAHVDASVRAALDAESGGELRLSRLSVEVVVRDAAWPEPVSQAVVVSPKTPGVDRLVFGISPRLEFDAGYAAFFEQVVEQIDRAASRIEAFRVRAAVESERRNLLLQAPLATALLTGPRHVFELANPLFRELVGGRALVGKSYAEAFPDVADVALGQILDRVYQSGEPFVAEEYLVAFDRQGSGTPQDYYYRFNLEPIRDALGAVFGMMAVAIDITEQVGARRAFEKATLERERLLSQLEAANRAKDEFLATVSHELRTPLTSILGWARLLSEPSDPARVQRGLAIIERNARAQAQLIEDILDMSRIISGKVRMTMRRVDPAAVVNAAVEIIRPLTTAKQIRLLVNVAPNLGALFADEDRIQQVVWNLLSNALKFTPVGGEITVRVTQRGSQILITVRDTGKGISPSFLPHVFDRFRQDDTSTTKEQPGLGLGLTIVRQLVELHGGSVVAESEGEGRGATFTVSFPIRAEQPREDSARPLPTEFISAKLALGAAKLRELRVLVIDDQDDARELLAMVLEDAGATVTQACSVAAALQALADADFQVIVSDIGMPGEDGYSFIHRVRTSAEMQRARSVPALALTAFARAQDRERALAAGFQEHVPKPIDPLKLVDVVAKLACR